MPVYDYKCIHCGIEEARIAGLDDRTVVCTNCGQIMNRLNHEDDLYLAYWNKPQVQDSEASNSA